MTDPFDLRFLRDGDAPVGGEDEIEIGSDDLDLLPLEGDRVDLGEAAVQTLSLALDPFPRHPDADRILAEKGVLSEEAAGPITDADCQAMLLIAIARGSTAGGTILGAIALIAGPEKTRATPCSAARPNSTGSVNPSLQVNQPSIAAMPMSIRLEKKIGRAHV